MLEDEAGQVALWNSSSSVTNIDCLQKEHLDWHSQFPVLALDTLLRAHCAKPWAHPSRRNSADGDGTSLLDDLLRLGVVFPRETSQSWILRREI